MGFKREIFHSQIHVLDHYTNNPISSHKALYTYQVILVFCNIVKVMVPCQFLIKMTPKYFASMVKGILIRGLH